MYVHMDSLISFLHPVVEFRILYRFFKFTNGEFISCTICRWKSMAKDIYDTLLWTKYMVNLMIISVENVFVAEPFSSRL